MIKTALKVYKNNIWETLSIIGIVAIGIFAGLGIAIPAIMSATTNAYNDLVDLVKGQVSSFNANNFLNSLVDQFKVMDWANPIKTIQDLFSDNNLFKILGIAFAKGGLTDMQVTEALNASKQIVDTFKNTVDAQIWICVLSISIATLVSYLLVKIIVRARSTKNSSIGRFFLSLALNILNLALIYILTYVAVTYISNKVGYIFAIIGICLLFYILTFLNAIICYMSKEVRVSQILNFKNIFLLFVCNLIVAGISTLIIVIVAIFSDAVAILLSIPLLLITNIITESVVIAYITEHDGGETIGKKKTIDKQPQVNAQTK